MQTVQTTRTVYLDYLRVFASFGVVLLHVASQNWGQVSVYSSAWITFTAFDSITRWTVPVFVMISGALFLGRDIPIKTMYSKYVLRLAASFVFWALIYALFTPGDLKTKFSALLHGHYHMWFVLMLIGLYLCVPLLRPLCRDLKTAKYFVLISFIFAFAIPTLSHLAADFGGTFFGEVMDYANFLSERLSVDMVFGYVGYFVLGYCLSRIDLNKTGRLLLYFAGIIGLLCAFFLTLAVSFKTGSGLETYFGNRSIGVFFTSSALFVLFRYKKHSNRLYPTVQKMALFSYGAYLVHVLVMEQLSVRLHFNTLSFRPVLSVPAVFLIVLILSYGISAGLNQIPFVKKYFV